MSFATRCPECQTLFKVTLGQLQIREGQVRCGNCKAIFSGIDHLTAADTELWQQTKFSSQTPTEPPKQSLDIGSTNFLSGNEKKSNSSSPLKALGLSWQKLPTQKRLITLALGALVMAQLIWIQRLDISAWAPSLQQLIGQTPTLSNWFTQQPSKSLVVAGSGLDRLSAEQLQLELTLQNASPLPSLWPHIKIDLVDGRGQPLASKVLTPEDYQWRPPPGTESTTRPERIKPGQLVELRAQLNTKPLQEQLPSQAPSGFNLQVFDRSMPLL